MNCTIKDGKYLAPNGEESLLYKNLREVMSEAEANDIFVLSKTPSFQERVIKPLIEAHRNKTLDIPTNIKFKETFTNKIRTFHIYDGKTKVGRIQLTPYKDGFKVKSSLINEDRRGEGNGKFLYNYAISKLLVENNVLYTDTARTEDADRVWESLKKQGLSQDGKSVKPLPKEFDKNGEISMSTVLQYTADNFSQTLPLNAVEKSHLINLQIEGVETSDDLYNVLYDAFYKNNLFSPNINKLKKIYSEDEIRNILEDSEIQGRVKETIEKLRQTEEFTIPQIKYNKDFDVRSSKVNIIGQYKKQNPLKLEQQVIEQDYVKVPVVDEKGEQLETQLFYENAIKAPSDKSIRALQAIVGAHPMVDTTKLENKLIKTFKNYGMDIEGIERENFKELLDYVTEPTDENRKALEDVLGFVREPLTKPINILPENRSYQYLKTAKSEQDLFDEMSLIQTTVPNVYHKINKIDEQEMRDIQDNQDLTIPDYQLYKDYYGYGLPSEIETIKNKAVADGTFMKAPNGKPTNLSEDNWLFVRTATFKNWFGDWQSMAKDVEAVKSEGFPYPYFFNNGDTSEREIKDDKGNVEGVLITHSFSGKVKLKHNEFPPSIIAFDKATDTIFVYDHKYRNGQELNAKNIEDAKKELASILYDYIEESDPQKTKLGEVFQNIYPNVSKVVDKNGEPLVVNHGTDSKFNEFNVGAESHGIFLTSSKSIALTYGNRIIPSFLNIKNPKYINSLNSKVWDDIKEGDVTETTDSLIRFLKPENDGIILVEINDTIRGFKEFSDIFIVKSSNQIKSAENTRAQIEQESNDIRYFKKPSIQKEVQTNIQIDSEYLLNDFVADFAAEKLKNPTEFNRQFKITETGIELASNDIITLETIKAYIQDGAKYSKEIADYSLLSKDIPNLKEKDSFTVDSVLDKRVKAVNDINSVSRPTTEITIIDEDSFSAPNETQQFIRINNNVYEQQEQGYYNKIQKNTNPNFFDLNPQAPEFKNFDMKQEESSENKAKKLLDKDTDSENFSCLS